MRKYVSLIIASTLLAIALVPGQIAQATPSFQGSISLQNAGFEGGTTSGWSWWSKAEEIVRIGKDIDLNNSWYTPQYVPNNQGIRVHGGGQSIEINNEYRKWRGGVYQTVSAAPGTRIVFKVWAQGYTSSGELMRVRAGIDPNGGTSNGAVTWSGTASVGESYIQLVSPEVTVGSGGKATVFTWAETPSPANKTAVFFDDAAVEITGQAQAQATTPAQPVQPTSPPVVAQPIKTAQPQPDGSLVYTVQSGDTLGAIAMAYGTTVDSIMQLNGLSSTIISVGQRLTIRGATVPPTATTPPTLAAPPTLEATPVPPTGQICIKAYNDRDGNGLPGGVGEDLLPGVVFALSNSQGTLKNYTTDGLNEPYCFLDLLPDTYTVKIVSPTGYSATTPEVWSLGVAGGQKIDVSFGARRGGAAPTDAPTASPSSSGGGGGSSFLGSVGRIILGGLAVIVLIGLGAAGMYFVAMRR